MSAVYTRVEVRTYRCHGPVAGLAIDPSKSPYIVAVDSIDWAADVSLGFRMNRPFDTFRAADDGFGNLLRVPS